MSDSSFQLLLPYLQQPEGQVLLIADENLLTSVQHLSNNQDLSILSNRYDVAQACKSNGINSHFSDFDFSPFIDKQLATVLYRVSKERPVIHHVINQAFKHLQPRGRLILSGEKSDGIKNTIKAAAKLFGHSASAIKSGNSYHAEIHKTSEVPATDWLDDKHYNEIREIGQLQATPVYSKPGTFGWNKFDKGSEYLIELAAPYLRTQKQNNLSLLDLGCGYGYLSLCTRDWDFIGSRCATDNNAAALICLKENATKWQQNIEISAGDCGSQIDMAFDLILCNPPFHQGFDTDSSLTDKFLKQTRKLLKPGGEALFVVNQFIPLAKLADQYFDDIEELGNNGGFKVIALRKNH